MVGPPRHDDEDADDEYAHDSHTSRGRFTPNVSLMFVRTKPNGCISSCGSPGATSTPNGSLTLAGSIKPNGCLNSNGSPTSNGCLTFFSGSLTSNGCLKSYGSVTSTGSLTSNGCRSSAVSLTLRGSLRPNGSLTVFGSLTGSLKTNGSLTSTSGSRTLPRATFRRVRFLVGASIDPPPGGGGHG